MFWGWNSHGELLVASEAKSIVTMVERLEPFPPGHVWVGRERDGFLQGTLEQYYTPLYPVVGGGKGGKGGEREDGRDGGEGEVEVYLRGIRDSFTRAVRKG